MTRTRSQIIAVLLALVGTAKSGELLFVPQPKDCPVFIQGYQQTAQWHSAPGRIKVEAKSACGIRAGAPLELRDVTLTLYPAFSPPVVLHSQDGMYSSTDHGLLIGKSDTTAKKPLNQDLLLVNLETGLVRAPFGVYFNLSER